MMKNVLDLYYLCIYLKKRPKNDLVLFRFVLYTPQGLKTYQSCTRSFQVNSFCVLADSGESWKGRHISDEDIYATMPLGKNESYPLACT